MFLFWAGLFLIMMRVLLGLFHILKELSEELFSGFGKDGIAFPHKAADRFHSRFKRHKTHLAVAADIYQPVQRQCVAHTFLDHYRGVVHKIYLGDDICIGRFFSSRSDIIVLWFGWRGIISGQPLRSLIVMPFLPASGESLRISTPQVSCRGISTDSYFVGSACECPYPHHLFCMIAYFDMPLKHKQIFDISICYLNESVVSYTQQRK